MKTPYLVSTDWLAEHLEDPILRIIDVRGQVFMPEDTEPRYQSHYPAYLEGHIPGAVFVDWIAQLSDDPNHLRVAEPLAFARLMGDLGVDSATQVIAYDNTNGRLASRLWWALNYYGHEKVAVLDGGWSKWRTEGRPTSTAGLQIEGTEFKVQKNDRLLRQGDAVLHMLNGTAVILDMRSPDEYAGDATLARLSGHIPGAVNLPVNQLLQADGTFHSPGELRNRFAQVGIDGTEPEVVVYSNVGVDACMGVLALRIAGFDHGSVYDTSWQEWGNDERKPVEQGRA